MFDTAYTHAGTFHADDVFSTVLVTKLFPRIAVIRTNDPIVTSVNNGIDRDYRDSCVLVYDIGRGKFDHHQTDKALRPDGTPYAAFGLLWKEFGRSLCYDDKAWEKFDRDFVLPVDMQDNGVQVSTLSCAIGAMNPNWDDDISTDDAFWQAVEVARVLFDTELKRVNSASRAAAEVRAKAKDTGRILVLDRYLPWTDVVVEECPDILYVVFPSNRGGYSVQTVPDAPGSFTGRKGFPTQWLGNPDRSLGMTFCHPNNFLLSCDTLEHALKCAVIAVDA